MTQFVVIAGTITADGWVDKVFHVQAKNAEEAKAALSPCDYIPTFAIALPEGTVWRYSPNTLIEPTLL